MRQAATTSFIEKNSILSQDLLRQLEIVQNKETADNILSEFITSQWLAVRLAIATHPNASADTLEQLAFKNSPCVSLAVAKNVNSSVSLLERLAQHESEEIAIAAINNPSISLEFIKSSAKHRKLSIRLASIKSLLNRGNQDYVKVLIKYAEDTHTLSRLIVLFHPQTPVQYLIKNFRSYIWLERYAIAQNTNTPPSILEKLSTDSNRIVQDAAQNNLRQKPANLLDEFEVIKSRKPLFSSLFQGQRVSEEFLEWAINLNNKKVLLAVANNIYRSEKILNRLLQSEYPEVIRAASLHSNISLEQDYEEIIKKEIKDTFIKENVDKLSELVEIGVIPESILNILNQNEEKALYLDIAAGNISEEVLQKLIKSYSYDAIREIAQNYHTPAHILAKLATGNDLDLKHLIAFNPNSPPEVLASLATRGNFNIHQIFISNPNTPAEVIDRLRNADKLYKAAMDAETSEAELAILAESEYATISEAVARNPHTLPLTLAKLTKDMRQASYCTVSEAAYYSLKWRIKNTEIPEDVLKEIININDCVEMYWTVLKHPNLSLNTLEHLAQHENYNIREAVARHPKVSIEILTTLAKDIRFHVAFAVMKNPKTPESIMESLTEDIIKLSHHCIADVVKQPNIPLSLLERLSEGELTLGQIGVAANPKTPLAILEKFMTYELWFRIGEAIASNPNIPLEMMERLADVKNYVTLIALVKNPQTPNHIIDKIADINSKINDLMAPLEDEDFRYKLDMEIVSNPKISIHLLERLAKSPYIHVRYSVAANKRTSVSILEELYLDNSNHFGLAHNPNLPLNMLQELIKSVDIYKNRMIVKNNLHTPSYILEELASDLDIELREAVAKHPNTPHHILSQLAADTVRSVRQAVAENPNLPPSLLSEVKTAYSNAINSTSSTELANLAASPWAYVHAVVASNPHTSSTTLEQLGDTKTTNKSKKVLTQVFPTLLSLTENINTPSQTLERIYQSAFNNVRLLERIALHPHTPDTVLETLAKDTDLTVRHAVANNPHIPFEILVMLLQDSSKFIRRLALRRYLGEYVEELPAVLNAYGKSSRPSLSRFIVLLHPQTSTHLLIRHSRSPWWLERYAIAQNPNTPDSIRQRLAQDSIKLVRFANASV